MRSNAEAGSAGRRGGDSDARDLKQKNMHGALTHLFSTSIWHGVAEKRRNNRNTREMVGLIQKDLQHFPHFSIPHYLLSVTELQCVIRAHTNAIATMTTTTAKGSHSRALILTVAASTEKIYGCVMTKVATATATKKKSS